MSDAARQGNDRRSLLPTVAQLRPIGVVLLTVLVALSVPAAGIQPNAAGSSSSVAAQELNETTAATQQATDTDAGADADADTDADVADDGTDGTATSAADETATSTAGERVVVDDDGADCPDATYESVEAAVAASGPGDTVAVCQGTYDGNVTVTTPGLSLRAVNDSGVVLDGGQALDAGVRVQADRVDVDGFTIRNYTEAGVFVGTDRPLQDVSVTNNTISGIYRFSFFRFNPGIHLEDARSARVTDNRVTDSGSGVWLIGSSGSTVARNTVRENGYLGVLAISDVEDLRSETRRLERRLGESELPSATTTTGRSLDGPRRSDRRDAPVRPPERTDADRPDRLEQLDERRTERGEQRTRDAASTSRGVELAANATDRALSKEVNASLSNRWSTLALPDNRTVRRTPEAAGVTASDNVVRGNALSNNGGFFGGNALLFGGVDETIADNTIAGGSTGLVVAGGGTPTVRGNRVTDTGQGVLLLDTDRARLRNNAMANNAYNFDVTGSYDHDIDESNTVDGDPVLYRNGVEDFVLEGPTDYGFIGIVNAENVTVRNVTVSNQGNGIHLSNVDGGLVDDVTLTSNYEGIRMQAVDDVTVKRVTARNNVAGVLTRDASGVFVGANQLNDNLIGVVSLKLDNPAQSTGTPLPGTTVADNDISGNAVGTLHFGGSDVPRTDRVVDNDIDGGFIGVFNIGSSIEVADNRLSGSGIVLAGIDEESGSATVSGNTVRDAGFGLVSIFSDGSVDIENNCFVDSSLGLALARSQNHVLRDNEMRDNRVGMEVVRGYDHDIDRSNTVNGKPVYYLRGETGTTIGADADPGYLAVVDSTDVTIRDLTLTGIGGLPVAGSTDVTVTGVTVRNSSGGLRLVNTKNSEIRESRFENGLGFFSAAVAVDTCGACTTGPTTSAESAGNEIRDNEVRGFGTGISVDDSTGDTVANNTLVDNDDGIGLSGTATTLRGNDVVGNANGIDMFGASEATLRDNEMRDNRVGLDITGGYDHDIDRSNTVDGKPVYYLRGETGTTVDPDTDPGYLAVVDSVGVTVRDITLTGVGGLPVVGSTDVTVTDVTVQGDDGIRLINTKNSEVRNSRATPDRFGSAGIAVEQCFSCVRTTDTPADSAGNTVRGNRVSGRFSDGIELDETTDVTVTDNTVTDAFTGIEADETVRASIRGNTVRNSFDGVEVDCCFTGEVNANVATIEGNVFADNGVGIELDTDDGEVVVRRNAIVDNRVGVEIDRIFFSDGTESPRYEITRNRISGNDIYGVENQRSDDVVDATNNYWGAADGPSSRTADPLADPETGALADGSGDAVSAAAPDVSNVRFDPFLESPPSDAPGANATAARSG